MHRRTTPLLLHRAALLWWMAAAAFLIASIGEGHRPMFWVVSALFMLNGGLALHRARLKGAR